MERAIINAGTVPFAITGDVGEGCGSDRIECGGILAHTIAPLVGSKLLISARYGIYFISRVLIVYHIRLISIHAECKAIGVAVTHPHATVVFIDITTALQGDSGGVEVNRDVVRVGRRGKNQRRSSQRQQTKYHPTDVTNGHLYMWGIKTIPTLADPLVLTCKTVFVLTNIFILHIYILLCI